MSEYSYQNEYQFEIEPGQSGAGEIVSVDFETMMNAKDGFLVLSDGRSAKRVNRPSSRQRTTKENSQEVSSSGPKIVSDAMGFTDNQLSEMENDRVSHGFNGIEFRQDPNEPRFYQVHCSSERAKSEYMKHRGFTDQNSKNGSGVMLDAEQLDAAKKMVQERFGTYFPIPERAEGLCT